MQKKWDVLIAGSGPAGMAAAYGAARNGARVLLVEKDGFVGGMATSGLINSWRGTASSGFFERMQRISIRAWGQLIYDPEQAAELFRKIIEEYDITVLSQATVCAVKVNDKSNISSVQVLTRQGMMDFRARCYVDATGDGDLAAMAGVPYEMNESETGNPTVFLMVQLGGIDTRNNRCFSREEFESLLPLLKDAVQRGEIAQLSGPLMVVPGVRGGTGMMKIVMNAPLDATDARDVAQAEFTCRAQVIPLIEFLKKNMPGYSNCYLIRTASRVGLMQSRRIIGRYTVTLDDVDSGRTFSDWVVTRACPPHPAGSDRPCLPFTLPYGCLLPKKIKNLLLSGRCISGTREAFERYQTMPICMATGQAAGTAAAMAAVKNGRVRKLDVQTLQDRLLQQGVAPPRPQFVLQGISPILTDQPPEDRIKVKQPEEDDIPVIPVDAGSHLNPQQIVETFDEKDEDQPLSQDAHEGDEPAEDEYPAPEFTLNLQEMPDFDQLQAEEADDADDEFQEDEGTPETADAPIPQQVRPQHRAFRSDYELILNQLLNEERSPHEDLPSMEEQSQAIQDEEEKSPESLPAILETADQPSDNESVEPVQSSDDRACELAKIVETELDSQPMGPQELPGEVEPVEQPSGLSETDMEQEPDETPDNTLDDAGEEIANSDIDDDIDDDNDIDDWDDEDEDENEQVDVVSLDEISGDEHIDMMDIGNGKDGTDDDIAPEPSPVDEDFQATEAIFTIEEVQGSEHPAYEDGVPDTETVLTITPQQPEAAEDEPEAERTIIAEEQGADPGESAETADTGEFCQTADIRPPESDAPTEQESQKAEESSGSESTVSEQGADTEPDPSKEKESLVHQQSPSGRTYTYHRKNPDEDPAAWNHFAAELWEDWIGDGKGGKTKHKPNPEKFQKPIESDKNQDNYRTLRRDGKSPLDIDVQDLL